VKVPKQVGQLVIAAILTRPRLPAIALEEASGAALAVEGQTVDEDRDAGWAAGADLVHLRLTSSASVPAAGIKSLTLPGSHVHSKYAPTAKPT
jgi:hypothetical protein